MSWQDFQLESFNLTRKETDQLIKEVLLDYDRAIKDINEAIKTIYADILAGVKPENYYNTMIKYDRLNKFLDEISVAYREYSQKIGLTIVNGSKAAISNTYYRKLYSTQWLSPEFKFYFLPKEIIELSVSATKKAWDNIRSDMIKKFGNMTNYVPQQGTITDFLKKNYTKELTDIRGAITQSIVNGEQRSSTIKKITNIIGQTARDKDGYILSGAKANATRIFRTETNRTMNLGSYANSKRASEDGINIERELVSALDNRTRKQSASMDGQRKSPDKPFVYPNGATAMTPGTTGVKKYDINDRETVIDIVDGESPSIRRGRNPLTGENEVFSYKSFSEWAKENNLKRNKYGEYVGDQNAS